MSTAMDYLTLADELTREAAFSPAGQRGETVMLTAAQSDKAATLDAMFWTLSHLEKQILLNICLNVVGNLVNREYLAMHLSSIDANREPPRKTS